MVGLDANVECESIQCSKPLERFDIDLRLIGQADCKMIMGDDILLLLFDCQNIRAR